MDGGNLNVVVCLKKNPVKMSVDNSLGDERRGGRAARSAFLREKKVVIENHTNTSWRPMRKNLLSNSQVKVQ